MDMRRVFIFIALLGISHLAMAQQAGGAGIYDTAGKAVLLEAEPTVMNVELKVVAESFQPGIYARYAQKYLGLRASLAERSEAVVVSGKIALGKTEKVGKEVKASEVEALLPLPINRISSASATLEQQAEQTAELIFSLRKNRLDLITGAAGENVFGAGLKAALDRIDAIEKQCLDMFYGTTSVVEELHRFNIEISADKRDYMVCRVSESAGVVAADDLTGKPVVLSLTPDAVKEYKELQPLGPKDKHSAEYLVVPMTKCTLVSDATLLDSQSYALINFAKLVVAKPIKR